MRELGKFHAQANRAAAQQAADVSQAAAKANQQPATSPAPSTVTVSEQQTQLAERSAATYDEKASKPQRTGADTTAGHAESAPAVKSESQDELADQPAAASPPTAAAASASRASAAAQPAVTFPASWKPAQVCICPGTHLSVWPGQVLQQLLAIHLSSI